MGSLNTMGVALRHANTAIELKAMLNSDKISGAYRAAILKSYQRMQKQLAILTIVSGLLIASLSIPVFFFCGDSVELAITFIFGGTILAVITIILVTVYITKHAGATYVGARKLYRQGLLGLSDEEVKVRTSITKDERECLEYFKKLNVVETVAMLISLGIIIVIGSYISEYLKSYGPLVILTVMDVIYFICFRLDVSSAEIKRLSTGYYRLPKEKTCSVCGNKVAFLVQSCDVLSCHGCGADIGLESWEKKSYKTHKKIKWLLQQRDKDSRM